MTHIPKRQALLGGGLLLAATVWTVDHFRGGPQPAHGAPAPATQPASVAADWGSVDALVAQSTDTRYEPVARELAELERDLFVARPALGAQAAPTPAGPALGAASTAAPVDPPEPDFATAHRLTGVVIGPKRLAVVNDQVLNPGDVLDGYRLVDVQRAAVVFEQLQTGHTVRLELEQGPSRR